MSEQNPSQSDNITAPLHPQANTGIIGPRPQKKTLYARLNPQEEAAIKQGLESSFESHPWKQLMLNKISDPELAVINLDAIWYYIRNDPIEVEIENINAILDAVAQHTDLYQFSISFRHTKADGPTINGYLNKIAKIKSLKCLSLDLSLLQQKIDLLNIRNLMIELTQLNSLRLDIGHNNCFTDLQDKTEFEYLIKSFPSSLEFIDLGLSLIKRQGDHTSTLINILSEFTQLKSFSVSLWGNPQSEKLSKICKAFRTWKSLLYLKIDIRGIQDVSSNNNDLVKELLELKNLRSFKLDLRGNNADYAGRREQRQMFKRSFNYLIEFEIYT